MKKRNQFIFLSLLFVLCFSCERKVQTENENVSPSNSKINEIVPTLTFVDTVIKTNAPVRITRKIRKDNRGNLLFAAYEDIIQYDGKSFKHIPKIKGLGSFDAFDAFEDKKGSIWIASTHMGVFRYNLETYSHFTTKEGLAHDRTMCIYEDSAGTIWIGTEGGISCINGKSLRNFTTKDGLTDNNINTIMEDQTRRVWVGSRGTLFVSKPSSSIEQGEIIFTEFLNEKGQPFENIWSIVEDKSGYLWLGGQHGIWRIKDNSITQISTLAATGLYEDTKGNIWITHLANGSHKAGLSRFNSNSTLEEIPKVNPIFVGNGMFFGIAEDKKGGIWVGTLNGVFKYEGKKIIYFKNDKV